MNDIDRSVLNFLLGQWHDYADQLLIDEESGMYWPVLDWVDAEADDPMTRYDPTGKRRSLDA
jgi:hypothetical protein